MIIENWTGLEIVLLGFEMGGLVRGSLFGLEGFGREIGRERDEG